MPCSNERLDEESINTVRCQRVQIEAGKVDAAVPASEYLEVGLDSGRERFVQRHAGGVRPLSQLLSEGAAHSLAIASEAGVNRFK